jgi:hypothetical protein
VRLFEHLAGNGGHAPPSDPGPIAPFQPPSDDSS